jgi:hypothetical protein
VQIVTKAGKALLMIHHIPFPVAPNAHRGVFLPDLIHQIQTFCRLCQAGNIVSKENKTIRPFPAGIVVAGLQGIIVGVNIGKYGNPVAVKLYRWSFHRSHLRSIIAKKRPLSKGICLLHRERRSILSN